MNRVFQHRLKMRFLNKAVLPLFQRSAGNPVLFQRRRHVDQLFLDPATQLMLLISLYRPRQRQRALIQFAAKSLRVNLSRPFHCRLEQFRQNIILIFAPLILLNAIAHNRLFGRRARQLFQQALKQHIQHLLMLIARHQITRPFLNNRRNLKRRRLCFQKAFQLFRGFLGIQLGEEFSDQIAQKQQQHVLALAVFHPIDQVI